TSTGLYTAGATPLATDTVQATDSFGNTATATVTILKPVVIAPLTAAVVTGRQVSFSATDGTGTGYTWSIPPNNSNATITAGGVYTAGSTSGGMDVVRVKD